MTRDLGDDAVYADYEAMRDFVHEQELDDGRQQREADEEQSWMLEQALRECMTRGVSMKNMEILCHGCGIPLSRVTG